MWGLCNPEPCDLWPLWLQGRPVRRPALWRLWNHREVQQGPSSNNCSVLRGEAFPPLTQHSLVLQPTKHLSARLRGRAGHRVGWGGLHRPACGLQCGPGQCGDRVNLPDHSAPCRPRGALHSALTGLRSTKASVKKKKYFTTIYFLPGSCCTPAEHLQTWCASH